MKSELSFLTDLFLNDEVPSPIKKIIAVRIKEVEKELTQPTVSRGTPLVVGTTGVFNGLSDGRDQFGSGGGGPPVQAPSMLKIMAQHPDLIPQPPQPKTAAAAMALQERQKLINGAGKEKPESGRTAPRKL